MHFIVFGEILRFKDQVIKWSVKFYILKKMGSRVLVNNQLEKDLTEAGNKLLNFQSLSSADDIITILLVRLLFGFLAFLDRGTCILFV